jgi:hypothetical protein
VLWEVVVVVFREALVVVLWVVPVADGMEALGAVY